MVGVRTSFGIFFSLALLYTRVLQRYVTNPLLLRRRKFHIRTYALAVSDLRVYVCRDCLALCSGQRYGRNDTANLLSHLTNTALQELDPSFRESECVLLWDCADIGPILLRDKVVSTLDEARDRIEVVVSTICDVTG